MSTSCETPCIFVVWFFFSSLPNTKMNKKKVNEFSSRGAAVDVVRNLAVVPITTYWALSRRVSVWFSKCSVCLEICRNPVYKDGSTEYSIRWKKWVIVLRNDKLSHIIIREVWNKDLNLIKFYYVSYYITLFGNYISHLTFYILIYDMMYLLTPIWLTPGGSSTVHIYTQTVHRTTQLTTEYTERNIHNNKNT